MKTQNYIFMWNLQTTPSRIHLRSLKVLRFLVWGSPVWTTSECVELGKKGRNRSGIILLILQLAKMINWPFPPSLLNGREGFGNCVSGGAGGRVFWVYRQRVCREILNLPQGLKKLQGGGAIWIRSWKKGYIFRVYLKPKLLNLSGSIENTQTGQFSLDLPRQV